MDGRGKAARYQRHTQRIERHNLNLRQHLKAGTEVTVVLKSLSFSKSVELHESVELHDKVIGHYLNIKHYQ
ncbi:IS1 family transposase [Escherichia coli]